MAKGGYQKSDLDDISCQAYLNGVGQLLGYSCDWHGSSSYFAARYRASKNKAYIQKHLNDIGQKPELWNYSAAADLAQAVMALDPCE